MSPQRLLQVESLELHGRTLQFETATITLDLDDLRPGQWHVTLFRSAEGNFEGLPDTATLVVQTVDGQRLRGRVARAEAAFGAGSVRLTGIGVLEPE